MALDTLDSWAEMQLNKDIYYYVEDKFIFWSFSFSVAAFWLSLNKFAVCVIMSKNFVFEVLLSTINLFHGFIINVDFKKTSSMLYIPTKCILYSGRTDWSVYSLRLLERKDLAAASMQS